MHLRRNLARLDLAAAAPEDVRIAHRDATRGQMLVDRFLMLEHALLLRAMRDRHNIHVVEFRTAFAPVAVREDVMAPGFTAGLNLAPRRHRPMKERIKPRDALPARTRFHMLEERAEPA